MGRAEAFSSCPRVPVPKENRLPVGHTGSRMLRLRVGRCRRPCMRQVRSIRRPSPVPIVKPTALPLPPFLAIAVFFGRYSTARSCASGTRHHCDTVFGQTCFVAAAAQHAGKPLGSNTFGLDGIYLERKRHDSAHRYFTVKQK